MTKFISDQELKAVRKAMRGVRGTEHLPTDATALDRAKHNLCRQFLIYMRKKEISQRKLAELLDVPESRISEIVHYRIGKLTLDRLVRYYERINPNANFKVA
jgi:predicted XRE-type DNA-binding protein